jgi:hypothetical protein
MTGSIPTLSGSAKFFVSGLTGYLGNPSSMVLTGVGMRIIEMQDQRLLRLREDAQLILLKRWRGVSEIGLLFLEMRILSSAL